MRLIADIGYCPFWSAIVRFLMFAHWENWNGCLRSVIFCSGFSILFSSHQFTFSVPCTILVICMKSPLSHLFSGLSNLVFRVYFRKAGGVILSYELHCAGHFPMSLNRILDLGSRQSWQIIFLFDTYTLSFVH